MSVGIMYALLVAPFIDLFQVQQSVQVRARRGKVSLGKDYTGHISVGRGACSRESEIGTRAP
jgi:hypothetical protein